MSKFLPKLSSRHPLADETMLKYFVSTLEVRVAMLENKLAPDPPNEDASGGRADAEEQVANAEEQVAHAAEQVAHAGGGRRNTHTAALLADIKAKLAAFFDQYKENRFGVVDDAWCDAYRLERLLALIEPRDTLFIEVQRRLDEADDEAVPSAARLRAQVASLDSVDKTKTPPALRDGSDPPLRDMLLSILEDTHWFFQRKFHSRPIQKQATARLVSMGLFACLLFVLPYAYLYIILSLAGTESRFTLPLENWAWLPLWTALTSGFFGAMFSRLLFLQSNWNSLSLGALKNARDFSSIILRGAVGMSGAVVVYFFLQSGVLGGNLFPKFGEIGLEQIRFPVAKSDDIVPLRLILPNTALALLVVWCFLAGFSERLVPSILQTTETSVTQKPK